MSLDIVHFLTVIDSVVKCTSIAYTVHCGV